MIEMTDSSHHDPTQHGHGSNQHETREANLRVIILSSIGLVIGTVIICLIVWGMFNFLKYNQAQDTEALSPMANPKALPPAPRLQVNPTLELHDLRAREEHILNSYAWVDKQAGTVRIPIDKAMDLLAQRGLATRDYMQAGGEKPPAQGAARAK